MQLKFGIVYSSFTVPGYYIPSGTTVYYACPIGYYSSSGATACGLADIGNYAPLPAMPSPWSCSGSDQLGAFFCNYGNTSLPAQNCLRIFLHFLVFDGVKVVNKSNVCVACLHLCMCVGTGINKCAPGLFFTGTSGCATVPAGGLTCLCFYC